MSGDTTKKRSRKDDSSKKRSSYLKSTLDDSSSLPDENSSGKFQSVESIQLNLDHSKTLDLNLSENSNRDISVCYEQSFNVVTENSDSQTVSKNEITSEKSSKSKKMNKNSKKTRNSTFSTIGSLKETINIDQSKETDKEETIENVDTATCVNCAFINGIPYDYNEKDLNELLTNTFGPVSKLKLPRWHDTNRLRGFGHVTFKSNESFRACIDCKKMPIKGKRYLSFEQSMMPKATPVKKNVFPDPIPTECKTICVKNISLKTTEKELEDTFSCCGKIADIRLLHNGKELGYSLKGMAFIEFKKPSSVRRVAEKNIFTIGNRNLELSCELNKAKAGFHYRPEYYTKWRNMAVPETKVA